MFHLGQQESEIAFSLILLLFALFGWRQTEGRVTVVAAILAGLIGLFVINRIYEDIPTSMMLIFVASLAFTCLVAYGLGRFVYKVFASGRQ